MFSLSFKKLTSLAVILLFLFIQNVYALRTPINGTKKMSNALKNTGTLSTDINTLAQVVQIHPDRETMGKEAAKQAWGDLYTLLKTTKRNISIVLASAPSQLEFLRNFADLINSDYNLGNITQRDLQRLHIYHLDQYVGLLNKPAEYHKKCDFAEFLQNHFFALLYPELKNQVVFHPIKQVGKGAQGKDALHEEAKKECTRYLKEEIAPVIGKDGLFDIVVWGVGDENGHIAFIEPENADMSIEEALIPVKVYPKQQVSDGMFREERHVPEWAITMTLNRLIIKSKKMIGVIPTKSKANSTKQMLEGPIGPHCPASYVRLKIAEEPNSVIINLTGDSASRLEFELMNFLVEIGKVPRSIFNSL